MAISTPISMIIICITVLLSASTRSSASSPEKTTTTVGPVPALFIFGDSTVDPGNNNYIDTIPDSKANHRPYGQNGFFDEPTGRFTDGRVVVDFIAEYANLSIIPPFLQPSANFTHGANFASGGAGVLSETNAGLVIDLKTQVKEFEKLQSLLVTELGDGKARELIGEAVYFISIGSNDYMGGYILNPKMREAYPPEEFIEMVIANLTQSIQGLYERGARKFGFQSLAPLGCLPAFRAANPKADGGCFVDVSALALAHNKALSAVLVSLQYILKGFKYAVSDVYEWLDDRIHHPTKYGFKDGVNACCGAGPFGGIYSCGRTKEVSDYKVCERAEEHVWWDSVHATERVHEQLARTLWSDPPPSVGPYNLEDLFLNREKLRIGDALDDQDSLEEFGSIV